ncbi:hypothetical protein [Bizionia paragorgiae]|jgi:hypothetical protein|uniref:hypothetical protein n=1 Tax=Bizionia paragorgiae TaxID=283786 RepID=UPI00299CD862|nr:hypothetical protein [Bizionia paragorgiae]MDX1271183.1 hypothetical protein [Bizionia paragorgiae]
MKAAIYSIIFLFSLINSCNETGSKDTITLSSSNHLTEKQLYTLHVMNSDERSTNVMVNDSIAIGGGDPLPPCPDSSFTDCCPSLKYLSFIKGTQNIKIILVDSNGNTVQTFHTSDLTKTKDGTLIFSLDKLKASICSGQNKLIVSTDDKVPYDVMFR